MKNLVIKQLQMRDTRIHGCVWMDVNVYARMPVKIFSTTDVPFTAKNFYKQR